MTNSGRELGLAVDRSRNGGSVGAVNQVKSRLQALGLLDRAFDSASDDELDAAVTALDDEHREAVEGLVEGALDAASIRTAITRGRLDGTLESMALVLSDACLADCIEALGDHADHPTTEQLQEAAGGLIEKHGLAVTRIMFASTVAGEAPASAVIRDLLKNDDIVKLPKAEPRPTAPLAPAPHVDPAERAALKARRLEVRKRKQEEARAKREQVAKARNRF
jgi:hypothetical protein